MLASPPATLLCRTQQSYRVVLPFTELFGREITHRRLALCCCWCGCWWWWDNRLQPWTWTKDSVFLTGKLPVLTPWTAMCNPLPQIALKMEDSRHKCHSINQEEEEKSTLARSSLTPVDHGCSSHSARHVFIQPRHWLVGESETKHITGRNLARFGESL